MTVYADLLFIVNLYIDALLLSAVRRFLRLPLTGKRLLLASVLGGVFGLSALLPALPGVVLFPLTLLESLALCAAAFAPKPMTQLLKAVFLLFLFGAALSGLLTAAAYFLPIHGILLANGAVYFNISALTLILLTCVSYGVLYGFDRLFRKKEPDVFFAKLTITRQGKTVTLPAKIDTGLTLTEPFPARLPSLRIDVRSVTYCRRISECKARKMLFLCGSSRFLHSERTVFCPRFSRMRLRFRAYQSNVG